MQYILVENFFQDQQILLQLEIVAGQKGLRNKITSPNLQKYSLALAGYFHYFHPERLQILGKTEVSYLFSLNQEKQDEVINTFCSYPIPCFLVTTGLEIHPKFRARAEERNIPILRSTLSSFDCITGVRSYLEEKLAPEEKIHGVLLDLFGIGVLVLGKSGIGKSESALYLISRGHRLISDDLVRIRRIGSTLIGSGVEILEHNMEIMGLGIVNIRDLFGLLAIGEKKQIEMVVQLEEWNADYNYDRLGLDEEQYEILGVQLPCFRTPVKPGRSIGTIIEVAARNKLLKNMGYHSAREFDKRLTHHLMKNKNSQTSGEKNL